LSVLPLGLAPINPFTQIAPLVIVLTVTACKDAYEEFVIYFHKKDSHYIVSLLILETSNILLL